MPEMPTLSLGGSFQNLLEQATTEELACLQLEDDALAGRLLPGEACRIVRAALARGRKMARDCGIAGAGLSAESFIAGLGARVEHIGAEQPAAPSIHLAALTREGADDSVTVTLFQEEITQKAGVLASWAAIAGREMPDEHGLEELTLWHEAFHVLDFMKDGALSEEVCQGTVKGFFGARKRRIGTAQEIAAHSFAAEATGTAELDPWRCDLIYLACMGELVPDDVASRLAQARTIMEEGGLHGDL